MTTAKAWSKSAVKGHLMAAFQRLHRERTLMLERTGPGGDPKLTGKSMLAIAKLFDGEREWLSSLDPVPPEMRRTERADFLRKYAEQLLVTTEVLAAAMVTPIMAENFQPFGVALLQLLALEHDAKGL